MLETQHTREFYLTKAEEHPMLEKVIAGETTLTATLDSLLENKNVDKDRLVGYMQDLSRLVETGHEKNIDGFPYSRSLVHNLKEAGAYFGGLLGLGSVIMGLGMLVFLVAPLLGGVIIYSAGPVGLSGGYTLADRQEKANLQELKEKRKKILNPLYEYVQRIDHDIGLHFSLEHFTNARPRFEQTYLALGQEERAQIDTQLYGLLGVGGMKNMDEIMLGDYLTEILESVE